MVVFTTLPASFAKCWALVFVVLMGSTTVHVLPRLPARGISISFLWSIRFFSVVQFSWVVLCPQSLLAHAFHCPQFSLAAHLFASLILRDFTAFFKAQPFSLNNLVCAALSFQPSTNRSPTISSSRFPNWRGSASRRSLVKY